jgi:RNA polymerase sigma factor (sigma-70 family)
VEPYSKTNEELAQEFMAAVAANYHKHKEHLRIQKLKWQARDAFDADDVLQDCLVKCYDKILRSGLSSGYHYNAYFNTALTNNFQYYNQKRQRNRDFSFEWLLEEDVHVVANLSDVAEQEDADRLHAHHVAIAAAFTQLPEKYQEILRMDMNGLKYKEICRVLNLTMGQCKMRIKTGRDLIKAQLSAYPKIAND